VVSVVLRAKGVRWMRARNWPKSVRAESKSVEGVTRVNLPARVLNVFEFSRLKRALYKASRSLIPALGIGANPRVLRTALMLASKVSTDRALARSIQGRIFLMVSVAVSVANEVSRRRYKS
jgi:hypothetical protein